MEKLFAYGTLLDPVVQKKVFERLLVGTEDALEGYATETVKIGSGTFLVAVPLASAVIKGSVLDVTEEDLKKADAYETSAYDRKKLALMSGIEAWAYVAL